MAKGLYHCSLCKKHFFDAEATKMHLRDVHGGFGEVLRHPTKRELLVRDEALRAEVLRLRAEVERLRGELTSLCDTIESPGTLTDRWSRTLNANLVARAALKGETE